MSSLSARDKASLKAGGKVVYFNSFGRPLRAAILRTSTNKDGVTTYDLSVLHPNGKVEHIPNVSYDSESSETTCRLLADGEAGQFWGAADARTSGTRDDG